MAVRRKHFLALLATAVGLVMVSAVGVSPEAAATTTLTGPFVPGSTTPDTERGHTVEWTFTDDNACLFGFWDASASGTGLGDITLEPAHGIDDPDVKVTATITGNTGSTASLDVSVVHVGSGLDQDGNPVPCSSTQAATSTFTITGTVPLVPTTATLRYKPALPGFTGKLTADDGCAGDRKVQLFKVTAGSDAKLETKTTGDDGSYKFKGKPKNGTYYVKTPKANRGDWICGGDKSPNVKVG